MFCPTLSTVSSLANPGGYPYLKPTDLVKALDRWKRLDVILPEPDLRTSEVALSTYWTRFRALYPGHEIFEKLTPQQLATTLPIKLHGDEGRSGLSGCVLCGVRKLHLKVLQLVFFSLVVSKFEGKKKSPIMLLAWQPVLGRGTRKSIKQPEHVQRNCQRLNMLLGLDVCLGIFNFFERKSGWGLQ